MLYPNRLQAALLFDQPLRDLEGITRDFTRIEGMKSSAIFNIAEANPDRFYRLFNGAEELMLTFEYRDGPADADAFRGALSSAYTGIVTPDIRDRLTRTQSHILLEASHGVLAGVEADPKIAAMFAQIGRSREGATQPQFERRLAALGLMTRIASEHAMPLAVHWAQSDQLMEGDACDAFAALAAPGPLHIHPFLYGPAPAPGGQALVGIRTFGARHWLGREILIKPNVLPWSANYEVVLAFLQVATITNGGIIPDGDTFGPDDRSLSYRVIHHETGADIGFGAPEPADMPLVELVPLKHLAHGFVAPEYVPDANVFHDRAFPAAIMPEDQHAKLAEGISGQFEIRAIGDAPRLLTPPPAQVIAPTASLPGAPTLSGRSLRGKMFGRKGL